MVIATDKCEGNTRVSTGVATVEEGRDAGRDAARKAFDHLDGDRVDLCQLFCPIDYDFEAVVAGVRAVIGPEAALIGCSSNGTFTEDGVTEGVAVGLVASDDVAVFTGLGTGLSENVPCAVREAVADLPDKVGEYPYAAAINLHDGLAGVGEELALVTQQKLGPEVTIAGGSAADDHRLEATYVFCGDEVVEDGVVLALLAMRKRPIVSVAHGHEPLSEPFEVTAAEGPLVYAFDGRPAFEVWKDAVRGTVREELGVDVDDLEPDDQRLGQIMCEFEFGIDQGDRYKMRWPWVEDDSGTLHFAVDVPEGTVMRVMHGTPDAQIESARETARRARTERADTEVAGAFVYDCACRKIVLGEAFETAVGAMAEELDVPLVGFETYGEMCMAPGGFSGFHNTTTVVLLLPR